MNMKGKFRVSLVVVALGATALLAGCSSAPSRHGLAAGERNAAISPQARQDFDAAMQAIKAEEFEKGIALMDKVASESQKTAVPLINLALAQKNVGKLEQAEANLKKALALEPDNPVASNELAILYRKTGRFAESRQVYESILKKYPHFPLANKNLGILCDLYLRDYACALKGYQAYSTAMPDDKSARIWIADVQKRLGN
ncbi:MAG: repeat-containing protein [Moraxellaceae bacterium]|jgi:Flp pilus assembly protein TadD|nr:repeat-containing protein [Moraxellaceae bacterium]